MSDFEEGFKIVIEHERGYVNHKDDRGGATNWGITEVVARKHGYEGDMKDLPIETAKEIYKKSYWDRLKLDEVDNQKVANELFDTAVNMGTSTSGKFLQRTMNLLNRNERDYENLAVDGVIGNRTITALKLVLLRNEDYILKTLNILQGARYIELCEKNETQEIFYRGWLKRVEIKDI